MPTLAAIDALFEDLVADPRRSLFLTVTITDLAARTETGVFCAAGPDGLRCGYHVEPAKRVQFTGEEPVWRVLQALLAVARYPPPEGMIT